MSSAPHIRMVSTRAQRLDEPKQDGRFFPLQEIPHHLTITNSQRSLPLPPNTGLQKTAAVQLQRQYSFAPTSVSSCSTLVPSPKLPLALPAALRPLYKDAKVPSAMHDHEEAMSTEDLSAHQSISRKRPFWRTKWGIIIIVLVSNIILLGVILGIVLARHNDHWHHWRPDNNNATGGNSDASPSSVQQQNGGPPAASSTVRPIKFSSAGPDSTTPVSTPVAPASQPTGASQAGGNQNDADNGQAASTGTSGTTQLGNGSSVGQGRA